MNISICITVLNEEKTISALLDSLLRQSKKASEIIIVDGGSVDKTVEIIRHYQKRNSSIKLIIEKSSRARARNLCVEFAKGEIILMTDAGCVADKDWVKNITKPFASGRIDVVAGFYKMTGNTKFQKAASFFLGITPKRFNNKFLPSTRSIAFTRKAWDEIGGFPEKAIGTAEDTLFNLELINNKANVSRMKNATVEWGMPKTIKDFAYKIYNYAKGDANSKIIVFPGKGITSHNIKAIFVLLRYVLGLILLVFSIKNHIPLAYLLILIFLYFFWAYRKIYLEFGDWKTSIYGPVLQIISDISVMSGFISGIINA